MRDQNTKTISDLREHLFATIAALRDKSAPMDIERARAVSDVAQTIINSAKVEVDYLKHSGSGESRFIDMGQTNTDPTLPPGITGRTVHRLR